MIIHHTVCGKKRMKIRSKRLLGVLVYNFAVLNKCTSFLCKNFSVEKVHIANALGPHFYY